MTQKHSGVGVVVGRFQTPYLHQGHKYVLNTAARHKKLLVLLGVHRIPGSSGNELDFQSRCLMIQKEFPQAMILPLSDEISDQFWSQKLDGLISQICPLSEATLYHGRDSFVPYYHGKLRTVDIGEISNDRATDFRERCYEQAVESEDFRHGVFFGCNNQYHRVAPTADIAITRKHAGKLQVVLGRRSSDPNFYRFPGGFVEKNDECVESAAIREASEEVGVSIDPGTLKYIASQKIRDWRDTSTNSVLTFFYHAPLQMGGIKAGDDLGFVEWVNVEEIKNLKFAGDHEILAKKFIEYVEKNNV